MRKIFVLICCSAILFTSAISFDKLTDFVNPFIGTGGHGHTFPGATVPFGMVQLSPDTRLTGWDGCSGYHYSDSVIYGFSHTHLSGTGCSDYGDILVMPFSGNSQLKSGYINEYLKTDNGYGSFFDKKNESARPGYYSVLLNKHQIKAELTASTRCGFHKYSFSQKDNSILFDLTHRDEVIDASIKIINDSTIVGYRISRAWATEQHVYFAAKFSKRFKKINFAINDTLSDVIRFAKVKNLKLILSFGDADIVMTKVGISGVSEEGALKNLNAEIKDWNFDAVVRKADEQWNRELSKILVEGGTREQRTIFYTALYHTMIQPNIYQDVDGKYRGRDMKIHEAKNLTNYTVFSLWDTYRAAHPLYSIIDQKRTTDYINTFLAQYEQGGRLPVWELSANETDCMIGYHAVPVIADAFAKGIKGFDAKKALDAMKHSANLDHLGLEDYRRCGFVPQNFEHESVSKNLEYAYDDWCISLMAKLLDSNEDFNNFNERAQWYKNLFEPVSGFMRAKKDAVWIQPFDPREVNFCYTEANSWQYTFYVPQDMNGLIKLLGGKAQLDKKLDELFAASSSTTGREQVDITGLIGQYAHGNEPSHQIAYLYSFAGKPWKTMAMIHRIQKEMYFDAPDGLIGNEDCGQMSAWFVLSAMGFYPVTPAAGYYVMGTPMFPRVTINLENGKRFVIRANSLNDKNFYIQYASLNRKPHENSWLSHQEIMNGGELSLDMSPVANTKWGSADDQIPQTSITENVIVPVPFAKAETHIFTDSLKIELGHVDKNVKIMYSINKASNKKDFILYQKPFYIYEPSSIDFFAENANETSKNTLARFYQIPKNRKIVLNNPYHNHYSGGGSSALIDGIEGENDFRNGTWQGYYFVNLDVVVDLGSVQEIKQLGVRFLQDINSWIFMPEKVDYYTSQDGVNFIHVGDVKNNIAQDDWTLRIFDFKLNFSPLKARYIKVIGKNVEYCPKGHKGDGFKAFIFADEILIN